MRFHSETTTLVDSACTRGIPSTQNAVLFQLFLWLLKSYFSFKVKLECHPGCEEFPILQFCTPIFLGLYQDTNHFRYRTVLRWGKAEFATPKNVFF